MNSQLILVAAFVVIVVMLVIPRLRGVLVRLVMFAVGVAVAAAGVAMLMNNETIFEKPGIGSRVIRFVTMNSAAASASGSGTETCDMGESAKSQPAAAPTPIPKKHGAKTAPQKEPEP